MANALKRLRADLLDALDGVTEEVTAHPNPVLGVLTDELAVDQLVRQLLEGGGGSGHWGHEGRKAQVGGSKPGGGIAAAPQAQMEAKFGGVSLEGIVPGTAGPDIGKFTIDGVEYEHALIRLEKSGDVWAFGWSGAEKFDDAKLGEKRAKKLGKVGVAAEPAKPLAPSRPGEPAGADKVRQIFKARGVVVSGSPSEVRWVHDTLGELPEAHLKASRVQSIEVKSRAEVAVSKHGRGAVGFWLEAQGRLVTNPSKETLVHEFAHSLQSKYGDFVDQVWRGNASTGKVTQYGKTNKNEGWAEAYMLWARGNGSTLRSKAPSVASVMANVFALPAR